jgi:DNA-binding transcriptional ArsR family regulator
MLKFEQTLDAVFKCLADRGRRTMLDQLAYGEATLGQLAAPLDMTLPAVHQHLALLENAGLVMCEKRGRERWCRLDRDTLQLAETWLLDRRQLWEGRLDALDRYLDTNQPAKRRRKSK